MRNQRTTVDAAVNGTVVPAIGSHMDCQKSGGAVVATVDLRVRLDLDDVAACLWAWLDTGSVTLEELNSEDGSPVRDLIVESVANLGLVEVAGYRDELTATPPGVRVGIDMCREAARRLFAPAERPVLELVGAGR